MPEFRAGEFSQWVSRMWKNGIPEDPITGVTQDTRVLQPGNIYVAIRGENFDGHDFVEQAFSKGAKGALVNEGFHWSGQPVLHVPDTVAGLQDLARGYRRQWTGGVVGITGSVGKTTVKEMCADVLSMTGETHRTEGNYNNHIGLPLTMLAMPQTARHGVFEIGMNRPGEIGPLAELLQPKIGVMTDICNAHRGNFSSLEEIAAEKAMLVAQVSPSGLVILDCDSEWFGLMRNKSRARVVTVSMGGTADYAGEMLGNGCLRVNRFDYAMPLPGEYIMRNALRAIALGLESGMDPEQINEGLGRFKAPSMRWAESEIDGIHFINDAYNANPFSMRASLRTFAGLPLRGAKWVVVAGMRELGETAEKEHAELGRFIDGLELNGVVSVGELGRMIVCGAHRPFYHCAGAAEAAQRVKENLKAGDHVLLKASRGERLEEVLDCFKEI
jgi:UDP-N-acetylmuramoyl-tripeptide--D-alanyl-D-alanine ligase